MKTLIFLILLNFTTSAFAFDEWTKTDTALQATYTVLHVIDWGQTASCANGGWHKFETSTDSRGTTITQHQRSEMNPILGKHPTPSVVHIYFASTLIANTIISYVLPKPYRTIWQGLGIGVEVWAVGNNYNVGVRGFF